MRLTECFVLLVAVAAGFATSPAHADEIDARVIAWRRDFHQHPELGNQETRTAARVAEHLRGLGMEVRTGIGVTGVSGVLRGGKPGPRIAIRADMDALPVTEAVDLPFASKVTTAYRGEAVGVMHACGHDAHVAILMGVAEELAARRESLSGEVMFVFQPAEEGPPEIGEVVGAKRMLDEGVFDHFQPSAVLGLHVWSALRAGEVGVRSGSILASADEWAITVRGRQTHGSRPWAGVDPLVVAAQILLGAQNITARQVDTVNSPVVLTAGMIKGGVRFNIIPDEARMVGTLRTFDAPVREDVIARLRRTAEHFAAASDATAELVVANNAPATHNDPALYRRLLPALQQAMGAEHTIEVPRYTIAEDFSQFANRVPGFYFFVGATPADQDPAAAPANHSPHFYLDESALVVGRRAMVAVALKAMGSAAE
ncbi:MAG: amidohydrolase [Chiayiivirga sp.]|jgi:amidohydrolase|uniref:amidohydrolase n=1 Tax=Chiayiivirga sp. TaxID=2041042 RepID=UPI0025BEDB1F|nr:amidohydrolase [Chiayiivirga sp.]MCI1709506.1 amidohydrolase [Chiayiivirga sp.]MCI1730206.1 amidohydrolase [Chiayiivirga sp.]